MKEDNEGKSLPDGMKTMEVVCDVSRFTKKPDVDNLPIMPTRDMVMFPETTATFQLNRRNALELARYANEKAIPIGIVCQIRSDEDYPSLTGGLFRTGVVADVLSVIEVEPGSHIALIKARGRFRILGRAKNPDPDLPIDTLVARIKLYDPDAVLDEFPEVKELFDEVKTLTKKVLDELPGDVRLALDTFNNGTEMVNFICSRMPIEPNSKINLLSESSLFQRATNLRNMLVDMVKQHEVMDAIRGQAKQNLEQGQRQAILQQQLELIRQELYGDSDDEIDTLYERGRSAKMPREVMTLFEKEMEKLRRFNPSSPDYSVLYGYLDMLATIPWHKKTPTVTDIKAAHQVLEEDHYGLEKVKTRILEQLAMIIHNPKGKAPIICLVGAPGVGKTSIGRSVARALGRKYERVSFGGLHDEAEIRGHRRTYIAAMPGRIIDAIKRAGVVNPVLLLDEIDKIGADYKGDPSAALLEVLDPEQNCHFHDNYIDVDYDLSNVLFIATANTLSTIPRPLLDRMEIINIPGYLAEEKLEIARRHLLPRICLELGLEPAQLNISDDAIKEIITNYTSESGVRELEKKLSAIGRKAVLAVVEDRKFPDVVKPEHLYDMLGLAPHIADRYEGNDYAGVVTGLAWTEVGGEILMVESSLSPAKTPSLILTGKLGDVMKESAAIAWQWVRSNCSSLGIDPALFERYNLHVHFPEGAIPKDGPSAGITIVTSIVSTFLQRRVAPRIAMTGEVTLRGKVLPVGGIREKILAAKRAGINEIILSTDNRRDIEDMPAAYLEGMTFTYVDTVDQVLARAITDQAVASPKQF